MILIATLGWAASASTFGRSAKGCARRRRLERLLQPEVVDHQLRVGIARGQLAGLLQPPPGEEIDRQGVARGGREDAVDAGIGGVGGDVAVQHDAHADRARRGRPLGDRLRHRGVARVDRLDQGEAVGVLRRAPRARSWRRSGTGRTGETRIAPSTPTASMAATI